MKSILIGALTAVLAAGAQSSEAERQLKAAMNAEMMNGDLQAAIKQYGDIAAKYKTDRAVAAMALVRMAEAYQKKGDAQARKLYEQVVRDYSDQKQAVAVATARLAVGRRPAHNGVVSRQLWAMRRNGQQIFGLASRDGRYVPYTDWSDNADLFLHDLETSADRRLTRRGDGGNLFAAQAALSKDNSQIAYSFYARDHWEVCLASLQGSEVPNSKLLYTNPEADAISVNDWSPDSKWLAISLRRKDKTGQIGLLKPQDGSLRVLKSIDWRGPTKMLFSPDGRYLAFDLPPSDATDRRDIFVLAVDGSRESHVVTHPAEDVIAGWTPDGKWLLFRSDRAGALGLWKIAFADGKPQGAPELLQPDLPGETLGVATSGALYSWVNSPRFHGAMVSDIQMAGFDFESGRVLNDPVTFVTDFVGTNAYPDWTRDGKQLAYISRRSKTPVLVVRAADSGRVIRQVSPKLSVYAGAGVRISPDGQSFVTWGTDAKGRRGIYRIDAESGEALAVALTPEEGDGEALVNPAWSPDGGKVYYARFVGRAPEQKASLVERNLSSGVDRVVITRPRRQMNLQSWSLSPDGRHAAAATATPGTTCVVSISGGEPRDMAGSFVMWAPDSRSVVLRRRSEGGEGELWRVPLHGGAARQLEWRPSPGTTVVQLSPDGRHIAIMNTSTPKPGEVWVLDNFLPSQPVKR
ncbi:MAG: PD40 domain-containing protein [Bryobacterales bacterium]|nr:PD40 domain-containing protein [Bryobacterales bacterium]